MKQHIMSKLFVYITGVILFGVAGSGVALSPEELANFIYERVSDESSRDEIYRNVTLMRSFGTAANNDIADQILARHLRGEQERIALQMQLAEGADRDEMRRIENRRIDVGSAADWATNVVTSILARNMATADERTLLMDRSNVDILRQEETRSMIGTAMMINIELANMHLETVFLSRLRIGLRPDETLQSFKVLSQDMDKIMTETAEGENLRADFLRANAGQVQGWMAGSVNQRFVMRSNFSIYRPSLDSIYGSLSFFWDNMSELTSANNKVSMLLTQINGLITNVRDILSIVSSTGESDEERRNVLNQIIRIVGRADNIIARIRGEQVDSISDSLAAIRGEIRRILTLPRNDGNKTNPHGGNPGGQGR